MDWSELPPLAALRAFAVAGRCGSFSAAGRELNVTHAAVAQQVRALEERLGTALVHRAGRGLALTPEGTQLARSLDEGFAMLVAAVDTLRAERGTRPLQLTITQAFAKNWLMPRLGNFWERHPEIPVALHPDDSLADLRAGDFDAAIRFGDGKWPGVDAEMLVPADYVIAGTPAAIGDAVTLADLGRRHWVLKGNWPEQYLWLERIGLDPDTLSIHELTSWSLAEAAMERGLGLAVTLGPLVADSVAEGRVVIVHSQATEGLGYHIVTRKGPRTAALRSFVRWLKSAR